MKILGISAFYHDSAAALIVDGIVIAAAQEERFTRIKHDSQFPKKAISYCLEEANISLDEIDYVAFYDKPFLKFERLIDTYFAYAPKGLKSFTMALPAWIKDKLFQKSNILKSLKAISPTCDFKTKLLFTEHHQSHAASAFFPSPFEEAIVLTMDGVGEWATTSISKGSGNKLEVLKEIHFPHSLGLLYSAFTYYTGFKVNSGEYKLMGLAPYGEPIFKDLIYQHLIDVKDDGSFRLNMSHFDYCTGLTMTSPSFSKLFGHNPRKSEEPLTQFHMDIAASIQVVLEEVVIKIATHIRNEYQIRNLCLAGGVALNCVANGKLLNKKIFDKIWIQPASGDAGGALGAALSTHYQFLEKERKVDTHGDQLRGSYLGPSFSDQEIKKQLNEAKATYQVLTEEELIDSVASALEEGKSIGWFDGRMEFGPRALGNRSIIADARNENAQRDLNLKIKFRESFRPFAPSVLAGSVQDYFELDGDSPYMLIVSEVSEKHQRKMTESEKKLFGIEKLNISRSNIPAVTHVDYSARIQTVHPDTNPKYHKLISKFNEKTGCPLVVNTSFNVRGEPIVCTPKDAFNCFMGCDLDYLAIGNFLLKKEAQNPNLKKDYKNQFELD